MLAVCNLPAFGKSETHCGASISINAKITIACVLQGVMENDLPLRTIGRDGVEGRTNGASINLWDLTCLSVDQHKAKWRNCSN
jgi:hypothetical protein